MTQAITTLPPQQKDAATQTAAANPQVEYSLSGGMIARLAKASISLAFTSYQSGLLYMLGRNPKNGAQLHQSQMAKPMGLARTPDGGLVMTGMAQVYRFANVISGDQRINHVFDACFVPRTIHVTGRLDAHDVGVTKDGEIVFVNTRYNCLAKLSDTHSFEVVWKPDFISAIVDEDRCHLNGMAMEDGEPRYVTAVSRSDTIDGWRDRRGDGGVVIDVKTGEVVCEGLSMPHSPRLHNGQLWVLNSGTGELGVVELPNKKGEMGKFVPKAFCPGFLRGLAFHGDVAFVGLSKPRYKRFDGLDLADRLEKADSEPWCGIQAIDLKKGSCVDWFRIDGAIGELYDVEVIEGHACPMTVSPNSPDAAALITIGEGAQPADKKSSEQGGAPGKAARPGR
ncbi:TIGR03032 family protein [Sphingomicrobium aestuariivivum]|uniref:TIGR03032 family protein n=1 Tax=Sphingomicrobium aestuariivivum TaxID=1582356 RepID=UPI001FD6EC76|nr:TIGR03032 family protein [Sphingomicrobium aestuariivivum]MCJ8191981.1 TIGR03032 family protein [Sphingomicrobium aestuariivivum]